MLSNIEEMGSQLKGVHSLNFCKKHGRIERIKTNCLLFCDQRILGDLFWKGILLLDRLNSKRKELNIGS
ncbi:hypothetical protein A3K79_04910 [Candidatus Bathyarchaeota archaeon RBG_13_46_16b]|nr:MAG: hypothetical protein A3K79_04910 [Candidatus Bathyarchaeota archaeon RBG_13_46_16b]